MTAKSSDLRSIEHRFPEHKELVLHPISDVHIEATTHRDKEFRAKLEELVKLGDNHRILLMGDLLDAAIASSKGFYHGAKTVQWAIDKLVDLFKPLANRVDLIMPGNHEERVGRATGVDITQQFAALLGRLDVYRPLPTIIHYSFFGRTAQSHTACNTCCNAQVFVHHGHGGGARPGSSVNRLEDLAKWKPDCDLYLMGHVHRKFAVADEIYMGWPVRHHYRMFVCTGTWLGHEHYAQRFGLGPQRSEGSAVITMRRDNSKKDGKRNSNSPVVTAEV